MITIPTLIIGSMAPLWTHIALIDPAAPPPKDRAYIVGKVDVSDDDDAGTSAPKTLLFKHGPNIEPGGPWLGIQFGPVSKATSTQLHLDTGQMVINVHENSPADQAGLQQYDVITAIDGQKVSSNIDEFLNVVRGYKPGEVHTLNIVRGGQTMQITLTVGTRPEDVGAPKYKSDDEDLSQGQVFNRGGMLQKDDKGNWVFKGFNMPDMPDVWKALPPPGDHDFFFNVPVAPGGPNSKFQMFMKKDSGKTIRVEKADDGKITVMTTVSENGKETTTTKTYAGEDEMKASDPDAAKMLGEGPPMRFKFFHGDPMHAAPLDDDMRAKIEEAMKNAQDALKNGQGGFGFAFGDPAGHAQVFSRKARTSFEVTPDGKVKVTTRKGEDEITNVYDKAEALRQANPDQYKKFERLQGEGDHGAGPSGTLKN